MTVMGIAELILPHSLLPGQHFRQKVGSQVEFQAKNLCLYDARVLVDIDFLATLFTSLFAPSYDARFSILRRYGHSMSDKSTSFGKLEYELVARLVHFSRDKILEYPKLDTPVWTFVVVYRVVRNIKHFEISSTRLFNETRLSWSHRYDLKSIWQGI